MDKIGYTSANLLVALGCLCGVEAIAVYLKIVEMGQRLRGAEGGRGSSPPDDAESPPVSLGLPTPPPSAPEEDMPPTYEEAMAHKAEMEREEQRETAEGGGGRLTRGESVRMQPSLTSASLLR